MGGMGIFEIAGGRPNLFACAMPIFGGGNSATAGKLFKTNWWFFHNEKDNVVNLQLSEDMATAILNEGGTAKVTTCPNANQNSWHRHL
jgi:predicted peptidase